jgi:GTA TIM-barrel-like domain
VYFHLDPLWSSSSIDFIGVDNYQPLSDWRDGTAHLDYASGTRSIYDRSYLKNGITSGENFDWYYASQLDRDAQTRTPIADGAYGKPWVYRSKDF